MFLETILNLSSVFLNTHLVSMIDLSSGHDTRWHTLFLFNLWSSSCIAVTQLVLEPVSGILSCSKQGLAAVPPVCLKPYPYSLETAAGPDSSSEHLNFSCISTKSFLVRPSLKSSSYASFLFKELDSSNSTCTLSSTHTIRLNTNLKKNLHNLAYGVKA